MAPIRASEPNVFVDSLPDPAWVECPNCGKPARVVRKPHRYRSRADARVTCGHCAYRHEDADLFCAVHSPNGRESVQRQGCEKCGGDKFDFAAARLTRHVAKLTLHTRCLGCGHTNAFPARSAPRQVREGHDHWFGLPLVLRASYGKRLIWAYNLGHIDALEGWIAANLRERSLQAHYMTMAARLPRWMKAAHSRQPVLRALAKMRAQALRNGLS